MVQVNVNVTKVEEACEHLLDAHSQLSDMMKLNGFDRMLVLALVAHISEAVLKRTLCEHDLAAFERLRAKVIERAEATRVENIAADAAGVNSEGGNA